jgi:hypothetical protein
MRWLMRLMLVVCAASFLFMLDYSRQGGWNDAISMWNLKARMIFLSDSAPLMRIADPSLTDSHPDYPLLLPSLVARGWQYMGTASRWNSLALAAIFTILTFGITFEGIRVICGSTQAYVAGWVLMGTPFFLEHGASQYADIVLCCFMTGSVVLFSLWDADKQILGLPLLAGLFAGFAACTKNEGILFVLVIAAARVVLAVRRGNPGKLMSELLWFGLGILPGLVTLGLFKMNAPPNEIVGQFSVSTVVTRIQSSADQAIIWKMFVANVRYFGSWWVSPVPLLLVHFLITRIGRLRRPIPSAWGMPALVLAGMLAGYYAVFLATPHSLMWHLDTSLSRLLLQVWPVALVLYSTASTTDR